jgi:hypothetical protein
VNRKLPDSGQCRRVRAISCGTIHNMPRVSIVLVE